MKYSDKEIYSYHERVFKPLYADLVAVLASKPAQISAEIEAAFSHMAFASTNETQRESHYIKAFDHLRRASLDASKILWLEYRARASEIIGDKNLNKYLLKKNNASGFYEKFHEAEIIAKKARQLEVTLGEYSTDETISLYYESAQKFAEVLVIVDSDVYHQIRTAKQQKKVMSWLSGALATGIGAALITDMLSDDYSLVIIGGLFGGFVWLFANGVRQWIK